MMPNINPRQMQQMMKKMGIQQNDIDAEEVIIRCKDHHIIISNPSVQKVNMMGQESYQISGEERIETVSNAVAASEEDIRAVMEQTQCTQEEAEQALKDTEGNIAEAIILMTAEKEL